MNRCLKWLGFAHSCGKAPVFALLALTTALMWRESGAGSGAVDSDPPPPISLSARDAELIDDVLAKRAPDVGYTLRQQLGIAIAEESLSSGYDPLLVLSIIDVESRFDDEAVSPKGARGLMQITPSTLNFLAKNEGIRLTQKEVDTDPALRVRLGIRYLRALQDRFHDLNLALMAYNAGPAKLGRALKGKWAEEFRAYPRLVRGRFRRFREGVGLDGEWALAEREHHRR